MTLLSGLLNGSLIDAFEIVFVFACAYAYAVLDMSDFVLAYSDSCRSLVVHCLLLFVLNRLGGARYAKLQVI